MEMFYRNVILVERFRLTLHRETKELPIFALVVAKNRTKLKESAEIPAAKEATGRRDACPGRPNSGRTAFRQRRRRFRLPTTARSTAARPALTGLYSTQ
ncbi:MAG: TIGR03435 family protein [Bryobacteraceae bacterium]